MFQLCSACQRHIKSATCPFCGSTEATDVTRKPRDAGRISRAQLLTAVAVAGALTVSACSDEPSTFREGPEEDVGGSTGGAPIYGAPPSLDDAGQDGSSSGDVPDASNDAGEPTDASGASDADGPDAQ